MGAAFASTNGVRTRAPLPQTLQEFDDLAPGTRYQLAASLKGKLDTMDEREDRELLFPFPTDRVTEGRRGKIVDTTVTTVRDVKSEISAVHRAALDAVDADLSAVVEERASAQDRRRASCLFMAKRRWIRSMHGRLTVVTFFTSLPLQEPLLDSDTLLRLSRMFLSANYSRSGLLTLPELDFFITKTFSLHIGFSVLFSKLPHLVAGRSDFTMTLGEWLAAMDRFLIMTRTEVARFAYDQLCNDTDGSGGKLINPGRLLITYGVLKTSREAHDINEPLVVALEAAVAAARVAAARSEAPKAGAGDAPTRIPKRNQKRKTGPTDCLDWDDFGEMCTKETRILAPLFDLQAALQRGAAPYNKKFWTRRRHLLALPDSDTFVDAGCHRLAVALSSKSRVRPEAMPLARMHPAVEEDAFSEIRLPARPNVANLVLEDATGSTTLPEQFRWDSNSRFQQSVPRAERLKAKLSAEERALLNNPQRAKFMAISRVVDQQGSKRQLYIEPGIPTQLADDQTQARLKELAVKFTRGKYATWKSSTFKRRQEHPQGAQLVQDYLGGPVSTRMLHQVNMWRKELEGDELETALDEMERVNDKEALSPSETAKAHLSSAKERHNELVLPDDNTRVRTGGAIRGTKGYGRLLVTSRSASDVYLRRDRHGMAPRARKVRRPQFSSPTAAAREAMAKRMSESVAGVSDTYLMRTPRTFDE